MTTKLPARPQTATTMSFAAASIKRNTTGSRDDGLMQNFQGGRFTAMNVSLRSLVVAAFRINTGELQIPSGDDWIVSEKYDVEAIADMNSIPAALSGSDLHDKIMLMLQALLEERFKLKVGKDIREQPVYELVVAKQGAKLQKPKVSEEQCSTSTVCHRLSAAPVRGFHGDAIDMADLVKALQVRGRIVVDKTGIQRLFSIDTTPFRPEQPPANAQSSTENLEAFPTIFTLLEEQLGLRLEVHKSAIEVLVIENAEKPLPN